MNKQARRLKNGSYELTCRVPLVDCLSQAEERCKYHGYIVKSAHEKRHRLDAPPAQTEYTESAATIVCERPDTLLDLSNAAASARPPPTPHRTCRPGSTQQCVGPAGCRGGQRCLLDGSAYGECDCGPAPAAPSATAPAPASPTIMAPPQDSPTAPPSSPGGNAAGGAP